MDFACLEMSILELWANDGKYDEATDKAMESLTNQDVLDKLNSFNKYEIIHLLLKYVFFQNQWGAHHMGLRIPNTKSEFSKKFTRYIL